MSWFRDGLAVPVVKVENTELQCIRSVYGYDYALYEIDILHYIAFRFGPPVGGYGHLALWNLLSVPSHASIWDIHASLGHLRWGNVNIWGGETPTFKVGKCQHLRWENANIWGGEMPTPWAINLRWWRVEILCILWHL